MLFCFETVAPQAKVTGLADAGFFLDHPDYHGQNTEVLKELELLALRVSTTGESSWCYRPGEIKFDDINDGSGFATKNLRYIDLVYCFCMEFKISTESSGLFWQAVQFELHFSSGVSLRGIHPLPCPLHVSRITAEHLI